MLWSQAVTYTRPLASSFRGFNRLITYCIYVHIYCACVFFFIIFRNLHLIRVTVAGNEEFVGMHKLCGS
jgi:hypothetical protein